MFEQLDKDGSGTLSKAEVAGLKELVDKFVEEKRSSQDPDEMVTYEEFEALFQPGGECKSATSRMFFELESTLGIPRLVLFRWPIDAATLFAALAFLCRYEALCGRYTPTHPRPHTLRSDSNSMATCIRYM